MQNKTVFYYNVLLFAIYTQKKCIAKNKKLLF